MRYFVCTQIASNLYLLLAAPQRLRHDACAWARCRRNTRLRMTISMSGANPRGYGLAFAFGTQLGPLLGDCIEHSSPDR
jgi:hypothetical protein